MEVRAAVTAFAVMLCLATFASIASAACTEIEETTDQCRNEGGIWLGWPVQRWVPANNHQRTQFNLSPSQSQIYWYCGSSRERTAWGQWANRLHVTFEHGGTIRWWIYKCTH